MQFSLLKDDQNTLMIYTFASTYVEFCFFILSLFDYASEFSIHYLVCIPRMNIWIEPTLSRRHGTSAAACVADFGGPRVVSWFERFGGIQTLHKEHQEIAGRSGLVVAFSGVWKVTHKYMYWISDGMYIYIYVCMSWCVGDYAHVIQTDLSWVVPSIS